MIDYQKKEARFVIANQPLVDALLAMNTHNRKRKQTSIRAYKKDMELGTFLATNQGVGVSQSGVLIDGQNRLIAIKELNYPPIEFLLVTGLDDAAQRHVDTHSRRTQADTLALTLNQTTSTLAVAALNARQLFSSKNVSDRLTIDQLAELLIDHHEQLTGIITRLRSITRAGIVGALLDYSIFGSDEAAFNLAERIGTGENIARNDPAYKIRQYVMANKHSGAAAMMQMYRLMITACVADWMDKPLSVLRETEAWPSFKTRRVLLSQKESKRSPVANIGVSA